MIYGLVGGDLGCLVGSVMINCVCWFSDFIVMMCLGGFGELVI